VIPGEIIPTPERVKNKFEKSIWISLKFLGFNRFFNQPYKICPEQTKIQPYESKEFQELIDYIFSNSGLAWSQKSKQMSFELSIKKYADPVLGFTRYVESAPATNLLHLHHNPLQQQQATPANLLLPPSIWLKSNPMIGSFLPHCKSRVSCFCERSDVDQSWRNSFVSLKAMKLIQWDRIWIFRQIVKILVEQCHPVGITMQPLFLVDSSRLIIKTL